jgi:hypothetical protein
MLDVFVNSVLAYQRSFTTLADAQAFFTDNPVDIGFGPGGPATVELVYDLTGSQISSGFQFDYRIKFGSIGGHADLFLSVCMTSNAQKRCLARPIASAAAEVS